MFYLIEIKLLLQENLLVPIDKFRDSLTICATKQDIKTQSKKDVSPKNLPLPVYFHFGVTDSAKAQYEQEQEKIIDFFSGKDFAQTTLEILLEDLNRAMQVAQ